MILTRSFRDHHSYRQSDIDKIVGESQARGAQALVTTAKDAVKLRSLDFALPCYVTEIEIEIERADLLRELILKAIGPRYKGSGEGVAFAPTLDGEGLGRGGGGSSSSFGEGLGVDDSR